MGDVAGLQKASWGTPGESNGPKPAPIWAAGGSERSRQDEPNEVHESGRIRASSGCNGTHFACPFAVPPDMAVVGGSGPAPGFQEAELPLNKLVGTAHTRYVHKYI
jgi:hypothetical protein